VSVDQAGQASETPEVNHFGIPRHRSLTGGDTDNPVAFYYDNRIVQRPAFSVPKRAKSDRNSRFRRATRSHLHTKMRDTAGVSDSEQHH
jgi:hypothetical protein